MSPGADSCALCARVDGLPVWADARWQLVRTEDTPDHPAFWRLVLRRHAAELSELTPEELHGGMDLLVRLERVVRLHLQPAKVNVASLGNLVPHVHWHLIARFHHDRQFPAPVWAPPAREADPAWLQRLRDRLPALDRDIAAALDEQG